MGGPAELTVAERIRTRFDDLTRAERQLADAMLRSYPVSGLGSITALAEAAEVSTPTVARMARKLGFGGFPALQSALRAELEARISSPAARHDRWAADAPEAHILNRFAEATTENLRRTLGQVDPAEFDALAGLLADPKRSVQVVGGRITRALADYFATHLQVIRPGVTLLPPNANTWPHYLLDTRPGDVLVAFDIRRYEREIERLAEMAAGQGAELVLVTDQWGSPAAAHARFSLHCRVEVPSAWDSSVVPLFVVEALIAAVQAANREETRKRMRRLEALFDRTGMFRKFT